MLPSIWPKSQLYLSTQGKDRLSIGDVVSYINQSEKLVSHRIEKFEETHRGRYIVAKGDSQTVGERISPCAVAFVVERVEHPWFSYSMKGPLGRFMTYCAVEHEFAWRLLGKSMRIGLNQLAQARSLLRRFR